MESIDINKRTFVTIGKRWNDIPGQIFMNILKSNIRANTQNLFSVWHFNFIEICPVIQYGFKN